MSNKLLKSHYKQTLRLGFPIAVGQIGVIILGFADTLMVGHYGTDELAAASFVNSVFGLVTFLMMGYAYGLTPLIGKLFGSGKKEEAGATLKNGLVANCIYGGVLLFVMGILYFFLDKMGQPENLLPLIRPYYIIIWLSMFFVLAFNTLRQFTDGITDTSVGMWTLLTGNMINIVGNWLLIYGHGFFPRLGLMGAGLSTLSARIIMALALVLIIVCMPRYARYRKGFKSYKVNKAEVKRVNAISLPVSLQMGMETSSFTFSAIMAGWIGAVALAGYQVIITISQLSFLFYYSFAAGMSIRIAAFEGTQDWSQLKMATRVGRNLLFFMSVMACLAFYLFGTPLIHIFTEDTEVIAAAALLILPLMIYQFGDAMQICYANALRGVGSVVRMMWVAGICYLLVGIPSGYIMGFIFDWGIQGVFMGLPVGLFSAAVCFYLIYRGVEKRMV